MPKYTIIANVANNNAKIISVLNILPFPSVYYNLSDFCLTCLNTL